MRMDQAQKKFYHEFSHCIHLQMLKQQVKGRERHVPGHHPQTGGERMLTAVLHPGLGFRKFSLYSGKRERRYFSVLSFICLKG